MESHIGSVSIGINPEINFPFHVCIVCFMTKAANRSQLGMFAIGERVDYVARTATDVGVVHSQAQLVHDPVPYWKPVEFA